MSGSDDAIAHGLAQASVSARAAIMFVVQPETWPVFAAYVKQNIAPEGIPVTADDMLIHGQLLELLCDPSAL